MKSHPKLVHVDDVEWRSNCFMFYDLKFEKYTNKAYKILWKWDPDNLLVISEIYENLTHIKKEYWKDCGNEYVSIFL
jgi:hypothetical protein